MPKKEKKEKEWAGNYIPLAVHNVSGTHDGFHSLSDRIEHFIEWVDKTKVRELYGDQNVDAIVNHLRMAQMGIGNVLPEPNENEQQRLE
jgi:hypothetical protein